MLCPVSHACGHACSTKSGPCGRPVRDPGPCWQHRGGGWWTSEFTLPRLSAPASGPPPAVPLPARRSVGLERVSAPAAELALAGADKYLDRWVLEIYGNIGEDLWRKISASREGYGTGWGPAPPT